MGVVRYKMNYKQTREEFERKAGGIDNVLPQGIIIEFQKDKNGKLYQIDPQPETSYIAPRCVCGQTSHTLHKLKLKKTGSTHWAGSCCINVYTGINAFGGKYGIKQGSYQQLIDGVSKVVEGVGGSINRARLAAIKTRLATTYGFRFTFHEKEWIETTCNINVRFDANINGRVVNDYVY